MKRTVHKTYVDWQKAVRVSDYFDSFEQMLTKGLRSNGLNAGRIQLYVIFVEVAGRSAKMTGTIDVFWPTLFQIEP